MKNTIRTNNNYNNKSPPLGDHTSIHLSPPVLRTFLFNKHFKMKSQEKLKTEKAIELVKDTFSKALKKQLNLTKVSSPIAILDGTGINDDLNGTERPVIFPIKALKEQTAVVVHSLAKWKRLRLKQLEIEIDAGILTDMRALRPDEDYSAIHSVYVDQWDWEMHISGEDRSLKKLRQIVQKIYSPLKETELIVEDQLGIPSILPQNLHFIHAEELLQQFPLASAKDRENAIAEQYGAVFIIGIGNKLSNGEFHDGRAPDYDDWSSLNEDGFFGLNGDLIVWNPILKQAFELSSMGIRVDKHALLHQLNERDCLNKAQLTFHSMLLNGQLPESIGGGIGQSRVCMFLLRKAHIGEVQVGIWGEEIEQLLISKGLNIL